MRWRLKVIVVVVVAGVWAAGIALGLQRLGRYEGEAGAVGTVIKQWPADAPERQAGGYTIGVFLHPECPCSDATVTELHKIVAHGGGRARIYVFAVLATGAPEEWRHSGLLERARGIEGVRVVEDMGGSLAREFGAMTSGETVVYDGEGRLAFSGGITEGRGHVGANAGLDEVQGLVMGRKGKVWETPVFGCSLFGECGTASRKE